MSDFEHVRSVNEAFNIWQKLSRSFAEAKAETNRSSRLQAAVRTLSTLEKFEVLIVLNRWLASQAMIFEMSQQQLHFDKTAYAELNFPPRVAAFVDDLHGADPVQGLQLLKRLANSLDPGALADPSEMDLW